MAGRCFSRFSWPSERKIIKSSYLHGGIDSVEKKPGKSFPDGLVILQSEYFLAFPIKKYIILVWLIINLIYLRLLVCRIQCPVRTTSFDWGSLCFLYLKLKGNVFIGQCGYTWMYHLNLLIMKRFFWVLFVMSLWGHLLIHSSITTLAYKNVYF